MESHDQIAADESHCLREARAGLEDAGCDATLVLPDAERLFEIRRERPEWDVHKTGQTALLLDASSFCQFAVSFAGSCMDGCSPVTTVRQGGLV